MKHRLSVVLADDDKNIINCLREMLSEIENVEIIGEASNGKELVKLVESQEPDVVIIDIEMPELNGLDAVNEFTEEGFSPYVIFLTGHNEFALEAYEVSAIDYLVKPVRLPRLIKAFNKIESHNHKLEEQLIYLKDILASHARIHVKINGILTFIEVEKIIMVESKNKKTIIYCEDEKYEIQESLNSLEEKLNKAYFYRTHKSYLVNLKQIREIKLLGNRSYEINFKQASYSALISRSKANMIFELLEVSNI